MVKDELEENDIIYVRHRDNIDDVVYLELQSDPVPFGGGFTISVNYIDGSSDPFVFASEYFVGYIKSGPAGAPGTTSSALRVSLPISNGSDSINSGVNTPGEQKVPAVGSMNNNAPTPYVAIKYGIINYIFPILSLFNFIHSLRLSIDIQSLLLSEQ